MTGCARFLIFLLFLAPIAYFGSKYLRDSGTWDKIRDRVEQRDDTGTSSRDTERPTPVDISNLDEDLQTRFDRLRSAYEEQELLLAKQDQTIKNLQAENDALRKRLNEPASAQVPQTTPQTRPAETQPSNTDSPSLEELLREADSNMGNTPSTSTSEEASGSRTTIGAWNFNYSGATGVMEFFRQNDRLFSRISIEGDNRLNIDELETRGNRIYVKNSPTGEYYIPVSNGNLEAYDENGFQTTCTRRQ